MISLFVSLIVLSLRAASQNIAVCITGQVDRWIPDQHLHHLIEPNPNYHFSMFFQFQASNSYHPISYHIHPTKEIANISNEKVHDFIRDVSEKYTSNNAELALLSFELPLSLHQWHIHFNKIGQPLDRITQFADRQGMILNMYKNQVRCIENIKIRESWLGKEYDYIIMTREDIYYFDSLNLTTLFKNFERGCSLLSKGCLNWGGVNTRMEIMKRDDGISYFGYRLRFYQYLFEPYKLTVWNPEEFEKIQLEKFSLMLCPVSVEEYGVAAARYHNNGELCFPSVEIQHEHHFCAPQRFISTLEHMKCSNFPLSIPNSTTKV